ncbi:MAG: malate/lactate/ureidoglycolate dehydrogenase [Betaproteobacteria bacterium]|nr:malate/lactate/ureidoglycolate dehydrogenase [Betaproteobacteria bacterium]
MSEILIAPDALTAVVAAILRAAGSNEREAGLVAGNLVGANLAGHDSHGIGMLPRYIDNALAGDLPPNQHARIELDTGPLLRVNGNGGYGQVVGQETMELGIARARQHGVCLVSLTNSHHLGRIGQWAEQCVDAGLVSVHFVNVLPRAIVAPFAGRDGRFSTNPFCVGIPLRSQPPFILDFATSRIAAGKVRVAYNKGERLLPDTLLDAGGDMTTDPRHLVVEPLGALLPFGEHKGYGLAMACELMAGAVAGGQTLHEAGSTRKQIINNMLSVIIDPRIYGTQDVCAEQAAAFVEWVKASPPRADQDVLIAGDPERRTRAERGVHGIPVDVNTWEEIRAAGARVGVAVPG